eukprot:3807924-Prorocentrum_lima.AAC.1
MSCAVVIVRSMWVEIVAHPITNVVYASRFCQMRVTFFCAGPPRVVPPYYGFFSFPLLLVVGGCLCLCVPPLRASPSLSVFATVVVAFPSLRSCVGFSTLV